MLIREADPSVTTNPAFGAAVIIGKYSLIGSIIEHQLLSTGPVQQSGETAYPGVQGLAPLPSGCPGTSAQGECGPSGPSQCTDACQPTPGTPAGASAGSVCWTAAPGLTAGWRLGLA